MTDLAIFNLASNRSNWLAAKGAAVAANVANADTPGYRPRDVETFADFLTRAGQATNGRADGSAPSVASVDRRSAGQKMSGNGVGLEAEMFELGEARSQQALVTGIASSFHRMLLSATKG